MQQLKKSIKLIMFTLVIGFLFITLSVTAQTPVDDPGIGGPGSPSVGVGGDGGPVVPLDGGMSLLLLASGISYGAKKLRKK